MVLDRNTTELLRDVSPVKAVLCACVGFKGSLGSGGVNSGGRATVASPPSPLETQVWGQVFT